MGRPRPTLRAPSPARCLARAPQAHLQHTGLAFERAQLAGLLLGHRKHHVARAVLRHAQHRRAGSQHRTGLGFDGGDDARAIGHQRRVARLVALHAGLRPGLLVLRLRRFERALAAVEFGGADETLLAQFLEALEVGVGLFGVDARGFEARTRRLLAEPQVHRVEAGQHLAGFDRVAQIDRPRHHLAGDAKRQPRLGSGAHLAGVVDASSRPTAG